MTAVDLLFGVDPKLAPDIKLNMDEALYICTTDGLFWLMTSSQVDDVMHGDSVSAEFDRGDFVSLNMST